MPATIKPIGYLKSLVKDRAEVPAETGQTVRQALKAAGIPPELVALVLVNDEHQDKDYLIQEGDIIKVVAVVGGG